MQYKIPQNVQIEDKIVGPLTLRQLIYLAVGGGIAYVIYTILATKYYIEIWGIFVIPIVLLTLAITFVKIKGIPFAKWILLIIEYYKNPRTRTFVMGAGDIYQATIFAKNDKKSNTKEAQKTKVLTSEETIKKINALSKVLDSYSNNTPNTQK